MPGCGLAKAHASSIVRCDNIHVFGIILAETIVEVGYETTVLLDCQPDDIISILSEVKYLLPDD